ncbi:glycine cleavage T C-terminal barrel domain-containing protein [Facilibium subflavum]|uniref:glycine cleavage T C-terminal barrel domain-containing protein n=1 Tax=Facilibium subflavum TaxID=2219058 RepID=UPI000E653363|nr:glycine cleavage T C-terminal barrel domain-containing protein [Facilibium subflavum]
MNMADINVIVNRWLSQASIEIVPRIFNQITDLENYILPGQYLYITYLPNEDFQAIIETAVIVQSYGGIPVAHIPARHIKDQSHLYRYVDALKNAGVRHVLLLAGDREKSLGCFQSTVDLLKTNLFDGNAFESIGFAAHPEGHPKIKQDELFKAIQCKVQWAQLQPCRCYFITQFVFHAKSILKWQNQLSGVQMLPVYMGLPGPTKPKALLAFAKLANIGWLKLLSMIVRNPTRWFRFAGRWSPEEIINHLASFQQTRPDSFIKGLHFYTFGGFKPTARWLKRKHELIFDAFTCSVNPNNKEESPMKNTAQHYTLETDAMYQINQTKKRNVPVNLRQSGNADVNMLISTRIRKSPFWHLSMEAGCNTVTVYNNMYHPRSYTPEEEGGLMAEYEALTKDVTMWNVAVERQIQIKGKDALTFTNRLVTRDLKEICPVNQARYVILCDEEGGIINDPVLLRVAEDEFWLSISDSDVLLWAKALNYNWQYDVSIKEIDVSPVQIQGPKSQALMRKLFGLGIDSIKYYRLWQTTLNGMDVVISRSGFSAEVGYEIYLRNATYDADKLWNTVLEAGKEFNLRVIAPGHIRRIEAGILSYKQDMDIETNPFECGLAWQVDLEKEDDYVGKQALAKIKTEGVSRKLVGLCIETTVPITWYNPDFWLVFDESHQKQIGYITSAFYSPKLGQNIALAMVPIEYTKVGTKLTCDVLIEGEQNGAKAVVSETPFFDPQKQMPLGDQLAS